VAEGALAEKGYAVPIDVLMGLGWLARPSMRPRDPGRAADPMTVAVQMDQAGHDGITNPSQSTAVPVLLSVRRRMTD
jgi:hypothetical protein